MKERYGRLPTVFLTVFHGSLVAVLCAVWCDIAVSVICRCFAGVFTVLLF